MGNGWSGVKEGGSDSEFTVIKEGKPVVVHLLGEPVEHLDHWNDKKESKACTGENCPMCADPKSWKKVKKTWAIPVFNLTTGRQETLQKGWSVIKPMLETYEAYDKNLSNVDFRISAAGADLNTEYTVINITPTKFKSDMITSAPKESDGVPF